MSFIGKEYTFVKQENFEEFVNSLGLSPEQAQGFINAHPNTKLVKDGDNFTLVSYKETSFKSGVELDEKVADRTCKTVFTLDGNVLTQVQKYEDGTEFKFVRTYSDDQLIVAITCSKYNGTATRYYKAV